MVIVKVSVCCVILIGLDLLEIKDRIFLESFEDLVKCIMIFLAFRRMFFSIVF